MSNVIESFFVALGFEIDTEKLDEFKQKTESLKDSALKIGALFTGAAVGVGAMILKVAEGMDDVGDFADIVGMSAREIDALGKVANQNDSSMDAMKSTLQGLAQITGDAAKGIGKGAMAFEQFGFAAKDADGNVKGAYDMLGEVADRMKDMSASERLSLAGKMRIDPSLIPLLSKGSDAFKEMKENAEAANPLTKEMYAQADVLIKAWNKATAGATGYIKLLAAKLFPVMISILNTYNDWVSAVKKGGAGAIAQAFQIASDVAEALWDWIVRLALSLKEAYDWMTKFKVVTYAAAAAVGVLIAYQIGAFFKTLWSAVSVATTALRSFITTGLTAAAPLVLIGMLVAAIALLIDDYVNFKEGNDSVIGDLVKQFPALLDIITTIEDGVRAFASFWMEQWDVLKGPLASLGSVLWTLIKTVVGALWPVVKMVFVGWAYVMSAIIPIVVSLLELVISGWVSLAGWIIEGATVLVDVITAIVGGVVEAFSVTFANIGDLWGALTDLMSGNFDGVADHLMAIWDRVVGFWMAGFEKIKGALSWVADKIGIAGATVDISGQAGQPGAAGNAAPGGALSAPGGVIGTAGGNTANNATTTNTTQITGTTITVNSPDPAKAGEAVKTELDRMNKQTVRNAQSGSW